jgi:hypothetical protein
MVTELRKHDDYQQIRLDRVKRSPAGFRYLPVLNDRSEIFDLVSDKALTSLPITATIKAGGLDSRLKSLTQIAP